MSMGKIKCPNCGATVEVDKESKRGLCEYCGSEVQAKEEPHSGKKLKAKKAADDDLANLYIVARRAKTANDYATAYRYYDQIQLKDPTCWEAAFYTTYCQAMQFSKKNIDKSADSIAFCLYDVLQLVKEHVVDTEERRKILHQLHLDCMSAASDFYYASYEIFDNVIERTFDTDWKHLENGKSAAQILEFLTEWIHTIFGDDYDEIRAEAIEDSLSYYTSVLLDVEGKVTKKSLADYEKFVDLIRKFKPDFELPITPTPKPVEQNKQEASGCYIATSIYGSYDCPEVWLLRRFRDQVLDNYSLGRFFIKTYYAISPTLVSRYGGSNKFKCLFMPILNKIVASLKKRGWSDLPYRDKY